MKNILKLSLLLFLSIFAACNSDDGVVSTAQQPSGDVLKLVVSATDFVTDGAPDTRVTDSEEKIFFENEDRVGVIILDGSSNILANNVPYKYSNGAWSFDSSNNEGKDQCYYYNKATTYIVYYPYNQAANSIKTVDVLKDKFKPQVDQSTKDAYRASDLMVWSHTSGTPLKSLNVTLTHAYASVSFFSKAICLLDDGKNTPANISDVNIMIDKNIYIPYQAADGSSRYILPDGFAGKVRCFYTVGGKESYSNTIDVSSGVIANTRYTFGTKITATYTLADAKVGDFYCKRSDNGNGYLIPGDAALTDNQKKDCVGIVFWVGSKAFDEDPLLQKDHPDCSHGLVVALQDAALNGITTMNWSKLYEFVQNSEDNSYKDSVNIQKTGIMCGYSNTLALKAYNTKKGDSNGLRVLPCDAIQQYSDVNPAPTNSSGWYFPSVMELKYVCWGQGQDIGFAGWNYLNTQIGVSGGSPFNSDYYWSSTEGSNDSYRAGRVYFGSGLVTNINKSYYAYRVRPLLAF